MPVFKTIPSMDAYILGVTIRKEIIPIVKIVTEEKLNDRVESEIYDNVALGGNDDFYSNTFGLRKSAESIIHGSGIVNDGSIVETRLKPKGKYEAYYGNEDVTDDIVELLNNGHKGFYKNLSINDKGRHFIQEAQKDLTRGGELKKRVSNALKKIGYKISRISSVEE